MSKKAWIVFTTIQFVGIIAVLVFPHTYVPSKLISSFGVFCWFLSFFIQMPGNFISGWIIERFFWMGKLTLHQLTILDILLVVIVNLTLWILVAATFRGVKGIVQRARN